MRVKRSTVYGLLLGGSVAALSTVYVSPAAAQTTPAQAAGGDNADDTIIVTATRREENIQDIGLSVTALTNENLVAQGVEQFFDFATEVPNLSFGFTGDGSLGARTIAIRGIGGRGTTGFYIDDTPVINTLDPRILDIARVEILRGPQGTLFGARSMGGVVRLVTTQPDTSNYTGYAHAGVSFTDRSDGVNYITDGALNAPIVKDRLALRISGYYQYEEGVFDKGIGPLDAPPVSIREDIDDLKSWGGQAALRWEVADNLVLTPRFMYQYLDLDAFRFADRTPGNFLQRQIFDRPEGGTDEWYLASFTGEYDAGWGEFVSTTSYFDRFIEEAEDSTNAFAFFFATELPGPITRDTGFERFVHETRFASAFDGPLQVNAGVFFADSETAPREYIWIVEGYADLFGGPSDVAFRFDDKRTAREISVFGEISYDITSSLQATVGARFFDNKTTFEQTQSGFLGPVDAATDAVSEDGVNLKFLLEYKPFSNLLTYASAAEGYRIGGNNIGLVPSCDPELEALGVTRDDVLSFNSDSLWTYEIGAKAAFANGRATLNAAAFRTDWSDLQTSVLLQCGLGFTGNSGEARIDGFEIELAMEPVDGLTFNVNAGYNDARITEAGPSTGQAVGDPIFQVPDWTFSANVGYVRPLIGDYDGFVRVFYSYVGESFSANNDTENPRLRPSYDILDARIGVKTERYEFTIFGKNLTNEIANLADNRSIGVEVNDLQRIVTNRPRTIGVEVRASF